MLADPSLAAEKVEPMRTVIDFGGPNVAKALHVGHLRSFVIGESLRPILLEIGQRSEAEVRIEVGPGGAVDRSDERPRLLRLCYQLSDRFG